MFNETSYSYTVTDPQGGDEITQPGDIFAEDDLGTEINYDFEPNEFSEFFEIAKYPDETVKITYTGGLAGASMATLVIEVGLLRTRYTRHNLAIFFKATETFRVPVRTEFATVLIEIATEDVNEENPNFGHYNYTGTIDMV